MLITAQLLRLKTLSIIFIDLSARPGFPGRVFYVQTRAGKYAALGAHGLKRRVTRLCMGTLGEEKNGGHGKMDFFSPSVRRFRLQVRYFVRQEKRWQQKNLYILICFFIKNNN